MKKKVNILKELEKNKENFERILDGAEVLYLATNKGNIIIGSKIQVMSAISNGLCNLINNETFDERDLMLMVEAVLKFKD